jgi:hypothetical protein
MMAQLASSERLKADLPWRICYWSGFVFVFAWAVWQRFGLPLDPIADPDTWGYLSPALRKLTGAEFAHTEARNFVYPGFLYLILSSFGDFRAITIVQHLLGLVAGGIFLATWRRLRAFVQNSLVIPEIHDAFGLAGAAIYLLASDTTRIETQLRPEGICAFLLSINLYSTLEFVYRSFAEHRRLTGLVCGIAAVFSSFLLASVKPSFWFVTILVMIPVVVFFARPNWWRQKIALALASILAAALLLWPEQILSRKDPQSQTFLPTMLFVVHADLIRDQMAEDLRQNAPLPYSREWLARVHAALNAEITKSQTKYPEHYPSLNFNPEYLWFDPSSIAMQLSREFGRNVSGLCAFYRFYYWRTWQRRPLPALEKVARQLSIFYFPQCRAYAATKFWPLTDVYERCAICLGRKGYRKIEPSLPPLAEFARRIESLSQNAPVIKQLRPLRLVLTMLAKTYLPSLAVALVLSAIVFWQSVRWQSLRWLATFVLFGCAYTAASCLEVAIVNSLDVHRYITALMYATLLTQLVTFWLILEFALSLTKHRRIVV